MSLQAHVQACHTQILPRKSRLTVEMLSSTNNCRLKYCLTKLQWLLYVLLVLNSPQELFQKHPYFKRVRASQV